ncbi:MAG: hypothetical protein BWK74_02025 [Desulfobacteraceae bacterium A6]|nr:MAG: hypothetical protein BWK74_02025 [Desulfobacteraceae bacterium A6]
MAEFIKDLSLMERLKISLLSLLASWSVRLWFGTVRVKIINRQIYEEYFLNNKNMGNIVVASWHRHAVFLFYFFRNIKNGVAMVSRSKDGELVARVGKRFGYDSVRGSSSKGGGEALLAMINYMNKGGAPKFCGTAVDGPRGPARILKKGMLVLAKETGSYFIPMACSGTNVITFHKAWDKTIIPFPFSTVVMEFHDPFIIPKDISEEELENLRVRTEKIFNEITDNVDKITGYNG